MVTKPYILVVDDKEWERKFLKEFLEESGYKVDEAGDGEEAIEKIKNNTYDLVITDLRMGEQSGFDVLKTAKTQSYKPEVIVITAYGTIESAVNAIKLDAFDYLTKPLDSKRVLITIGQALERKLLRNEVQSLRNQLEEKYSRKRIVAESDEMRKILEVIDLVTRTDSTVLIEGESGTGKELVARALHFSGPRASKPFITVNCAALPEPLLESELFGHVKGTFTGAVKDKKGLFEEADEGTLLLDEIAEMPMSIQVKLLRVLQEGSIRKVGGAAEIDVDVRIIASTNKKLASLAKEGNFREDLFYRLNVIPMTVPPLRERKKDIAPLVEHFVKVCNRKLNKKVRGFTAGAMKLLINHDWPGNIRELENLVERTITFSTSDLITAQDLSEIFHMDGITAGQKEQARITSVKDETSLDRLYGRVEKEFILNALERNGWNQSQTAREIGISRSSLWTKMKKHTIKSQPPS